MKLPHATFILSFAVFATLPSLALAQASLQTVKPIPGQSACGNGITQIGSGSAKVQICLKQTAGIGGDAYLFNINEKTAVQASDEQSIKGASSKLDNFRVSLDCVRETKPPEKISDIMVRTYQRTMKVSEEEARKMIIKQESIEVARRCSARVDDRIVLEVQFKLQ